MKICVRVVLIIFHAPESVQATGCCWHLSNVAKMNQYKSSLYKSRTFKNNTYKSDESIAYALLRMIRLLVISAVFIVIFAAVYFLFIGSVDEELFNSLIAVGLISAIIFSVKALEKKKLSDTGIYFRAEDILLFFGGVMIAVSWSIVLVLLAPVVKGTVYVPQALELLNRSDSIMFKYFSVPLAEELLFRGYMLNNTFSQLKMWQRSILVSGLFTIPHILPNNDISLFTYVFAMCISTFVFGILLNYCVSLSKSIWLGFGLHWAYDFIFSTLFENSAEYDFMIVMALLMILITLFVLWALKGSKQGTVAR